MNGKQEIEARLDRSLASQVEVPRLDERFNAAVWARIAADEQKAVKPVAAAAPSRVARASRWLAITNSVGVAVTLGIVAYFLLRNFGGIETPVNLSVEVPVSLPEIPEALVTQIVAVLGQVLGVLALVLGLSFTSFGRRVRASFS
jgi:hypothetical protein